MITEEHDTGRVQPGDTSQSVDGSGQSNLEQLVDALEEALADGRRMPFSGRLLVDEERFLDLIDRLRVGLPDELRLARRIMQEQERILREAEEKVQATLSEQGLLDVAEAERQRILDVAQAEAERIKADADDYARQVLLDLEERVGRALTIIQNGLDALGVA